MFRLLSFGRVHQTMPIVIGHRNGDAMIDISAPYQRMPERSGRDCKAMDCTHLEINGNNTEVRNTFSYGDAMAAIDIAIVGEVNLDLILYGLDEAIPLNREILGSNFEMT